MNLREFVDTLNKRGLLVKVKRPVDVKYEIATLMKMLDGRPILFEDVKGYSMPIVANVCSSRELVAIGLGVKKEELMG
ncbi:MAG: UbiD family decarboxylase, partial [Candidatus Hadarchaeota archaeon]|nr:UbiD family decarboxylase [Candidatus Hadarchaeota archaeon]